MQKNSRFFCFNGDVLILYMFCLLPMLVAFISGIYLFIPTTILSLLLL